MGTGRTGHGQARPVLYGGQVKEITPSLVNSRQGCAVKRYRLGRTRIGTNFWLCIWFGEPVFGYRLCKRYFLLILKIPFVDLLDTEPVSGSGSPIQISCIEHNLETYPVP